MVAMGVLGNKPVSQATPFAVKVWLARLSWLVPLCIIYGSAYARGSHMSPVEAFTTMIKFFDRRA